MEERFAFKIDSVDVSSVLKKEFQYFNVASDGSYHERGSKSNLAKFILGHKIALFKLIHIETEIHVYLNLNELSPENTFVER